MFRFLFAASAVLFATSAFAQAAAPAKPSIIETLMGPLLILGVMIVFFIRPQMKKQKEQKEFLSKLQRGDEVITASGILGRIEGLTDLFVTLEIAPDVRIKVLRSFVAGDAKQVKAPEVKS